MSELWAAPHAVGLIVVRTVIVYFFVLVGFRLTGKREVGQLAPFDFALILLIANSVQTAMVGPDTSLLGGLIAAAVLLAVSRVIGTVGSYSRGVERIFRGSPRILVYRGEVMTRAVRRERISHDELMQALRENGCATPAECRLAVLEVDGTISVLAHPPGNNGV